MEYRQFSKEKAEGLLGQFEKDYGVAECLDYQPSKYLLRYLKETLNPNNPSSPRHKIKELLEEEIRRLDLMLDATKPMAENTYFINGREYENTIREGDWGLQGGRSVKAVWLNEIGIKAYKIDSRYSRVHNFDVRGNGGCLNLRMLSCVLEENSASENWGKVQNHLYIKDRRVEKSFRGNGIGKDLLEIAEIIANTNQCKSITGHLIAEERINQDVLIESHRQRRYCINLKEDMSCYAVKWLDQSED